MVHPPSQSKIAVIGLGYVGLPLAHAFAEKYEVVGFDTSPKRVDELNNAFDSTHEITSDQLKSVLPKYNSSLSTYYLTLSTKIEDISDCNIYIITVPTPIDKFKIPDLTPLIKASETVGKVLKPNDIVIYESTVYPGCTEEDCVPILEKASNLKYIFSTQPLLHSTTQPTHQYTNNQSTETEGFFVGYSPERINPGDKKHTVKSIKKVVSGSTPEIADYIDELYSSIITAGTHKAASIKVAEAAKVIENTQRDINIAFVNELAMIFNKLGINTKDVLEAAGTKWNFLPFKPGLVGGHCIGVDPYYLAYKAQHIGHHPEMILAGRRINDNMGMYVANNVVKLMIQKGMKVKGANVLVLGITFKENCPDIRNSRVIDVIRELEDFGCNVDVTDPHADPDEVKSEYGINLVSHSELVSESDVPHRSRNKWLTSSNLATHCCCYGMTPHSTNTPITNYDAVVLAVAHDEFKQLNSTLSHSQSHSHSHSHPRNTVIYDIKSIFEDSDGRL
ncbi:MAG: nucleotide sugar dehydrogenase [Flexistipes sinusarabici]|uniref:Nucleotide sugar dehydrogenase n=1 Tax=Flexistipes sinusarabici TaxID=2352 RepID=A0A5D0MQH7_FLESI|nr:nucleotide sugar dehydrogenase [Flexistipes sinusarabici]TYB33920.1 MAG: nucleotide sugar dehydrogenase [Flexistipes sinusarabici]